MSHDTTLRARIRVVAETYGYTEKQAIRAIRDQRIVLIGTSIEDVVDFLLLTTEKEPNRAN